MADFNYKDLKTKYENFNYPVITIMINGMNLAENKARLGVTDIEVEMSSGFEAGMATFKIVNCYNRLKSEFEFNSIKKYIFMGSTVLIYAGYGIMNREIFRGFISKVNFYFEKEEIPGVEITAMDLKGLMMANNYSKQLKSMYFSDAVDEILRKAPYTRLQSEPQIITKKTIMATPDKPQGQGSAPTGSVGEQKATDVSIEMVCESDYEFVVKAAKKFNYEFFAIGGDVYFRKAKNNKTILMEIGPSTGIQSLNVEYDMTGLVEKIEVRGVDVGKAKLLKAVSKSSNKISLGNKAKPFIKNSQKVYIDPTIKSQAEAGYRAGYLKEEMVYRLGTLEAELIGIPELTPGRFIKLQGLGMGVSNTFYLVSVKHIMKGKGYFTKIVGKAASMESNKL